MSATKKPLGDYVTANRDTESLTYGQTYEVLRSMGDALLILLPSRRTIWVTKDLFA